MKYLAAATLAAVLWLVPATAQASWFSEWLHRRFDPGYYGYYSVPAYTYYPPTSYYYGPTYTYPYYSYPYYGYPTVPYYAPNQFYWYSPRYYRPWDHHEGHEWREHHKGYRHLR
jgi:hypothetical protein